MDDYLEEAKVFCDPPDEPDIPYDYCPSCFEEDEMNLLDAEWEWEPVGCGPNIVGADAVATGRLCCRNFHYFDNWAQVEAAWDAIIAAEAQQGA